MSNSLSPKKAPNFLNQDTLERVLMALCQPFSIAVFASLAAHGLLWAALPNLFDQPKELDTQRRVQVVELSPAEQAQLPPLGINPLPQTLVPVKPLPPAQSGTKLPDPRFSNDPLLDTIPIFQLPPNISLPDFSKLLSPNLTEPKKEPKRTPIATNREQNLPAPPADPGTPKKDTGKADDGFSAPARSTTLSPEQIALLQKEAQRSRQLQERYTFNGSPTDEGIRLGEILPKNFSAFEDAVVKAKGSDYDRSSYVKPERQNLPFPEEACAVRQPLLKKAQNVSLAAYFNSDGKLEGKPGLLLTSGFNPLDQLAIDYVSGITLKPGDKPRLVRFDLIFDPRAVCKDGSKLS